MRQRPRKVFAREQTGPRYAGTVDAGHRMESPLMAVLREYRACIDVVLGRLEAAYGKFTYDRIIDGELPLPGHLDALRFALHGTGCSVLFKGNALQWDWAPPDVLISDAWKLCQFTQRRPERFGPWTNAEYVRVEVIDLMSQGKLLPAPETGAWFVLPGHSEVT